MPEMHSVTSNYLDNMYHNSFYDKIASVLWVGLELQYGFQDTTSVFGYFFFYGPRELLCQRGPLHHDLKLKVTSHLYYILGRTIYMFIKVQVEMCIQQQF